jgi:hypothetical protein
MIAHDEIHSVLELFGTALSLALPAPSIGSVVRSAIGRTTQI